MSLVGCGGGNDSSTSDTKDSTESGETESENESTDESEETAALSGTVEFANDKLAGTDVAFLDEFMAVCDTLLEKGYTPIGLKDEKRLRTTMIRLFSKLSTNRLVTLLLPPSK